MAQGQGLGWTSESPGEISEDVGAWADHLIKNLHG